MYQDSQATNGGEGTGKMCGLLESSGNTWHTKLQLNQPLDGRPWKGEPCLQMKGDVNTRLNTRRQSVRRSCSPDEEATAQLGQVDGQPWEGEPRLQGKGGANTRLNK